MNSGMGRQKPTNGNWVPLMDYAMRKGVSLSTLRRQIKANKIEYRVESGRYLIWFEGDLDSANSDGQVPAPKARDFSTESSFKGRAEALEVELRKAQQEIAELKMLIALYEEKISGERLRS